MSSVNSLPILTPQEIGLIDKITVREVNELKENKIWWEQKAISRITAVCTLYNIAYGISFIALPTLGAMAPVAALGAVVSIGTTIYLSTTNGKKWVQKKADEIEPKLNELDAKVEQKKDDMLYQKIAQQHDTRTSTAILQYNSNLPGCKSNLNTCTEAHIKHIWDDFDRKTTTLALKGDFRNANHLAAIAEIQRECSGISKNFENYYSHYSLFVNQDQEEGGNNGILSKLMQDLKTSYPQTLTELLSNQSVKNNPLQTAFVMYAQSAVNNTYSIMKSHESALQKLERDQADAIRIANQNDMEQITAQHKFRTGERNNNNDNPKATLNQSAGQSILHLWTSCKSRMATIAIDCKFKDWNEEVKALCESCESYAKLLGDRNNPVTLGHEALFGESKLKKPIEKLKGEHPEALRALLEKDHVKNDPMKVAYIGLVQKAMTEMIAILDNHNRAYKLQEQAETEDFARKDAAELRKTYEAQQLEQQKRQQEADIQRKDQEALQQQIALLRDNQEAIAPLLSAALEKALGGKVKETLEEMVKTAVANQQK